jgi:phosphatidylinositol alpha-1,6-mannosyltransferase
MPQRRTLIVTNDFPPRQGGIQSFVHALALRQPAGTVVVYASNYDGAASFDAAQPFPIVRHSTGMLLPTPAARTRILDVFGRFGCTAAWFGAAAPLGLLAPALRAAGAQRIVATTHGHEIAWGMLPGSRSLLRRIASASDYVTYLAEYTRRRLAATIPHARLVRLPPGVDVETFKPGVDGSVVRAQHHLTDVPVVVCVARLVPRKGQDTLIRALPSIHRRAPDAALLLVGRGRDGHRLRRLAEGLGVQRHVVITGGVPAAALPAHYAAGDVFAMPCRTRRGGMDVEGLGMVFLEASAMGLPVVAGDSGGAPDAVQEGQTGYLVNGRDVAAVADRVASLLSDPAQTAAMGQAGRAWVERDWRWDVVAARLTTMLQE